MDKGEMRTLLEDSPVIAAVKDADGIGRALECESRVAFILHGDILTIGAAVRRLKDAGKAVVVHLDLIEGLSAREVAADFIRRGTRADGVISTKPALVRRARQMGLIAVQRFFLLDSIALQSMMKQLAADEADFVEVLPGVMPRMIRRVAAASDKPLIAGGLISDKEDVVAALGAGAIAVSSTNQNVWFM